MSAYPMSVAERDALHADHARQEWLHVGMLHAVRRYLERERVATMLARPMLTRAEFARGFGRS